MYYVEYGKNGSKLIFSEKNGNFSQFAGSYKLERQSVTSHCSQYRKLTQIPLHVNGIPSQGKSRTRNKTG